MVVYLLTAIHILVCFFLVIVVLLQSGKAADLAGAFGGMGSQTAFGPRGAATVLSRATTFAAVLFMVTSVSLSMYATRRGGTGSSILGRQKTSGQQAPAKSSPPAAPAPKPAAPGKPLDIQVVPPASAGGHEGHAHPPVAAPAPAQKK